MLGPVKSGYITIGHDRSGNVKLIHVALVYDRLDKVNSGLVSLVQVNSG